ncbi:MAG: L-threonylcarbamoyladenylate synthase [bacterium]
MNRSKNIPKNKVQVLEINLENFHLTELEPAVSILKKGGVIAYPTETVYGLGANIYHEKAVERINHLKKRDPKKPLSVMIASQGDVAELCVKIAEYSRILMTRYWPGPLTLILNASSNVPKYIVSHDNKIGLRMPNHPVTLGFMILHREPVITTSANLAGASAPIRCQQVQTTFRDKIDLMIDSGECGVKIPSTVLDVTGKTPRILREGAIPFGQIEQVLHGVTT